MTQDTKFRGWNVVNKSWKFNNMTLDGIARDLPIDTFTVDLEITQSLGFKDKNGKELYQGDIAICIDKDNEFNKKMKCVYNDEQQFVFVEINSKWNIGQCANFYDEVEIVGNIYENNSKTMSNNCPVDCVHCREESISEAEDKALHKEHEDESALENYLQDPERDGPDYSKADE